jgi:two-component system sensor histidine kinase QseC
MPSLTPSIRRRLLVGTILSVAFATLTGSVIIYLAQHKSLTGQLDDRLRATADLLTIEIELEDGEPYQEWLVHILDNEVRKKTDLIQVWGINSGETSRSPALGNHDLPRFHAELNQPVIQNVDLPGGRKGRALGIMVLPSYAEEETITPTSLDGLEQIFVIALETKDLRHDLRELRQTMTWVFFVTLLLAAISIIYTVKKSLVPIKDLSRRIQDRQTDSLGNPVTIPEDFPAELREMIAQYNGLLLRIEGVRTRERDFSTHAAHELRTPLAGIQATLEQAASGQYEPGDYVKRINQALAISKQMARLVTHLMRFSRLQSGTEKVILEEVNLHELIEATWEAHLGQRRDRNLDADWQLASKHFLQRTDEDLARILLTNLVDNAISYAEEGSRISLRTFDQNGNFVFVISNRSATSLPEDLDRFFEPFYRVDKARNADDHHAGIGLSLCREIAKNLHAEIAASTFENGDFCVTVTFAASR